MNAIPDHSQINSSRGKASKASRAQAQAQAAQVQATQEADDPVSRGLRESGRRMIGIAVFSGVINLLMLSGSLYMLQVYDRVIPSRNLATLLGLSLMVLLAYVMQGYFDALRSRMLCRVATLFDVGLQEAIHTALATLPLRGVKPMLMQQPLRAAVHGGPCSAFRQALGHQRHRDDRERSEQCGQADRRMKQKQPDQKDRDPGHVEERGRPHAGHEGPDLIEVAQRLLHQHRLHAAKRQRGERGMDGFLQTDVEQRRDAAQHPRTQSVEISLHDIG